MAMSSLLSSRSRRNFIAGAAAASGVGLLPVELLAAAQTAKVNTMNRELKDDNAIHPFRIQGARRSGHCADRTQQ
jgi:hypothetical protein